MSPFEARANTVFWRDVKLQLEWDAGYVCGSGGNPLPASVPVTGGTPEQVAFIDGWEAATGDQWVREMARQDSERRWLG